MTDTETELVLEWMSAVEGRSRGSSASDTFKWVDTWHNAVHVRTTRHVWVRAAARRRLGTHIPTEMRHRAMLQPKHMSIPYFSPWHLLQCSHDAPQSPMPHALPHSAGCHADDMGSHQGGVGRQERKAQRPGPIIETDGGEFEVRPHITEGESV